MVLTASNEGYSHVGEWLCFAHKSMCFQLSWILHVQLVLLRMYHESKGFVGCLLEVSLAWHSGCMSGSPALGQRQRNG